MERRRITTLGLALLTIMAMVVLLWAAGSAGASPPLLPAAQSGAPMLLNYQGRLVDPDTGEPAPDGNYGITFRIYDAATGGAPIWSETLTVQVEGGLFNVLLGSVAPLSAANFDGTARWLELEMEGETLTPRQRIVSTAYAIQAEWAKNAASATNADFLDGHDSTYYQQRVTDDCAAGSAIRVINQDGTVTCEPVTYLPNRRMGRGNSSF